MATSQFGTLNKFHPDTESIKTYLERVQLYFTANSVADVKQVPVLLSTNGSSTYVLLSDLLTPETPSTKTLDEITAVLKKHYEPKRAVIAERYHFHKRDQAMEESIAEYDAALRKLATHCKFGKTGHKAPDCRFKDADCHACGKKSHIAPACRSKPQNKSVPPVSRPKTRYHDTHLVQHEKNDTTDSESEEFHLCKLNAPSSNPIEVTVNVEDKPLTMELDTGAAVSIISEATRREMFPKKKLHKSKFTLKTYTL